MYSSHSLRTGGASKAANSGLNDRLIQRHGLWKSVSSKNMYIDDSNVIATSKCTYTCDFDVMPATGSPYWPSIACGTRVRVKPDI
jgi:hypothetical protein